MISIASGIATVNSAMTLDNAKALLVEGTKAIEGNLVSFDLAGVSEVDSSGLAVLFGWIREAQRLGKTVSIVNLPQNLSSLAEVYGVSDLLPLA